MSVRIDVAGSTDVGKVRKNNEDQYLVARLDKSIHVLGSTLDPEVRTAFSRGSDAYLFLVADGVGGGAGGEIASGTAVQTIVAHIQRTVGCFYNHNAEAEYDFLTNLEEAVAEAHRAVTTTEGIGHGSGATTLTMVALVWPRAYVVHVGDSRAYHLRGTRLRQLTQDQTMAELLVDAGAMTEEQAEGSRLEHVLSSAVGGSALTPSVGLIDLAPGDVLVLGSDGLTKHVPDEQIAEAAGAPASAEDICRRLVTAALDDGGSDNVTVVVARAEGEPV